MLTAVAILTLGPAALTPTFRGTGALGRRELGTRDSLPRLHEKPQPTSRTFHDCPPQGDGGDRTLNRLKNRVDTADTYYPVDFEDIASLPWARSAERTQRASWSDYAKRRIGRYEGIPVVVEGYLADVNNVHGAKLEGTESPNCHGADATDRDWHMWLVAAPEDDRAGAIVVETTPRVRADHPAWKITRVQQLAKDHTRVRISGWLLFDQEHPDQVHVTRGTIWEVHPVMRIEVQHGNGWVDLEDR